MSVVFGLGTRLRVRMRTKLEKWRPSQRTATTVLRMAFIGQSEFEAIKTPNGRRAPRCDKDQFRPKMTVST